MEDIRTAEQKRKDLRNELIKLRSDGVSWRDCAKELDAPQSSLRYLLSNYPQEIKGCASVQTGVQTGVQENAQSVQEKCTSVQDCQKQENTEEQKDSLAELKTKINILLHIRDNRLNKLEDSLKILKEELSNEFNMRVNKVISYNLKNHIESMREEIIKHLREELKQQ